MNIKRSVEHFCGNDVIKKYLDDSWLSHRELRALLSVVRVQLTIA